MGTPTKRVIRRGNHLTQSGRHVKEGYECPTYMGVPLSMGLLSNELYGWKAQHIELTACQKCDLDSETSRI